MEKTVYDITLALGQSPVRHLVTVKRYDSHAALRMRLVCGGKPYPVAEDCRGVFTARKPDGTVIYNPCVREGNLFLYDLTPQTTAAAGQLRCELKLYGPEEALLTSAAFLMEVEDTVYSGDEELASSAEAEVLTQLVNSAQQKIVKMDTVLAQAGNLVLVNNTQVGKYAWSSKRIADAFCPAFEETGAVVSCAPLEGYPLEVITTVKDLTSRLTLTRCGKNLFDFQSGASPVTYPSADGSQMTRAGYEIHLPAGTYALHAEVVGTQKISYIYGVLSDKNGVYKGRYNAVTHNSIVPQIITVSDGDVLYIYHGVYVNPSDADKEFAWFNIQLEAGDTPTPYEPYRGNTWEVDFSNFNDAFRNGAFYNWNTGITVDDVGEYWQHDPAAGTFTHIPENENYEAQTLRSIPAAGGVNYIYSSTGMVTVKGRKDIVQMLEKLTADMQ